MKVIVNNKVFKVDNEYVYNVKISNEVDCKMINCRLNDKCEECIFDDDIKHKVEIVD